MIRAKFNDKIYTVLFDKYSNGNIAIHLSNNRSFLEASYDFDAALKKNEVAINNVSDKQGIEDALIEEGVIKRTPNRRIDLGFYGVNVFELTGYALQEIKFQANISQNSQGQLNYA